MYKMTNRYDCKCDACGVRVPAGTGSAYKKTDGRWGCCCPSAACGRKLGLLDAGPIAPPAPEVRTLSEEGVVTMPYDEAATPILRGMPGARWRPESKTWLASTRLEDRPRVLEVARRLGLQIPASWEAAGAFSTAAAVAAQGRADTAGLYPYQRVGVAWLASRTKALLGDDMGLGKQQAVDTPVLTPGGYVQIGSLRVGDYVIGSNGKRTRVTGVFPQGVKPSYRMRLSDGASVESGPEHLWTVAYRCGGRRWQEITVTTDQIRTGAVVETTWDGHKHELSLAKTKLYLPMLSAPVEFDDVGGLPMDPYLMGQLIANGSCTESGRAIVLTSHSHDWDDVEARVSKCGFEIRGVQRFGDATRARLRGTAAIVRSVGLDVLSGEKFIPDIYKRARSADRVALLQGLMDGDGSCSKVRNKISYSSSSSRLAADIQELVEQLGGIASVRAYNREHEGKGVDYQVRIKTPLGILPFSTHRKADRLSSERRVPRRTVVDVEYVRDVESVCIVVDAEDHLYATDHAILTHNTVETLCALPEEGCSVIVAPAVMKYTWRNEAKRWRPDLRATVLEGRGSFRAPERGEILIVNYDILPKSPKLERGQDPVPLPYDLTGCTLVVDEAHKVKSHAAQRTLAVAQLARQCSRTWFLTGTPLLGKPLDLWGVLSAGHMAYEVFGGWQGFTRLYGASKNRWGGWEFGGPDPSVPERLRRVMLRRTKIEVLPDLPKKTYTQHTIDVGGAQLAKALDAAWQEWGDEDEDRDDLPSFTEFSALRARLAKDRIPYLVELVEDYEEQDVPILVFSAHREPAETIGKRPGWGLIVGGTPNEQRADIVEAFQAGRLKGVALTIAAGGVGLTLTRASTVLFCDRSWTPADNWQAEDRVVRIGQKATNVQIISLVSNHPLDQHVNKILDDKSRLIAGSVEAEIAYQQKRREQAGARWVEETEEQQRARVRAAVEKLEAAEVRRRVQSAGEKERARSEREAAEGPGRKRGGGSPMAPWEQPLTPEIVRAIQGAIQTLAGACDYAREKDESGFNRPDAERGHWLAGAVEEGGEAALRLAWAMARRYPRQVKAQYPELWGR